MAFMGPQSGAAGDRSRPAVTLGYRVPTEADIQARNAREQAELDWATGATARREAEAQSFVRETQLGGRALRAMQRAFSTMNAIAMGSAASGGSPLGGNNRDPLGLSSRPMGKSKFGA
jgi:hypothetical protein